MKITVLGAGSFGTALAICANKNNHKVTLWARRPEQCEELLTLRENRKYLEGIKIPGAVAVENSIREALKAADMIIFAVPTQSFRTVFEEAAEHAQDNSIIVNVAKGIEKGSLKLISQIVEEMSSKMNKTFDYVVLSGPSHAEEVGKFMPTTLVAAAKTLKNAEKVQDALMSDSLRIYTNKDVIGVELGGALKNIIALGAGISDGIGFGDNAKAALMTRGITEITRLGLALGASKETFSGLTGVGDLIVTCTSMHSRNRRCGILIGEGNKPQEAIAKVGMVVEGISTAEAAYSLAKKLKVEIPITEAICNVINEKITAVEAVNILMGRDKKYE